MARIGVVSDTHGVFREGLPRALEGADRILLAGDVGDMEIVERLSLIAPVTAVWGNTDPARIRARFSEETAFRLEGVEAAMRHIPPVSPGLDRALADQVRVLYGDSLGLFVFGHTHQPMSRLVNGVHLFNPGSAGPMRFGNGPSVGLIEIIDARIRSARIVALD